MQITANVYNYAPRCQERWTGPQSRRPARKVALAIETIPPFTDWWPVATCKRVGKADAALLARLRLAGAAGQLGEKVRAEWSSHVVPKC
jgi:hypothetical protein